MIPAIQSIAGVPDVSSFDPSAIPGVRMFIQSDNAVDDGTGRCSSIASLVGAGESLIQATANNRYAINTTSIPGHITLASRDTGGGTYQGSLSLIDAALFGAFNGAVSCYFGLYVRLVSGASPSISNFIYLRDSAASTANRARVTVLSETAASYGRTAAGTATAWNIPTTNPVDTWFYASWNYNALTGDVRYYRNTTLIATVAGTPRSAVGMNSIGISETGGATSHRFILGSIVLCTQELSDAEQDYVHDGILGMFS